MSKNISTKFAQNRKNEDEKSSCNKGCDQYQITALLLEKRISIEKTIRSF